MTTSQMIADFTTLAIQAGGWMELDRLYLQNRLLSMIGTRIRRSRHTACGNTRR